MGPRQQETLCFRGFVTNQKAAVAQATNTDERSDEKKRTTTIINDIAVPACLL